MPNRSLAFGLGILNWALILVGLSLAACHRAGPFGHAQTYAPYGPEVDASHGVLEYDPVVGTRRPETFRKQSTSVFGIVKRREPGVSGTSYLTLSMRRLEPRNLCENAHDEDTCRVTVTDVEFAIVHASVKILEGDDVGADAVGAGSLVRVLGTLTDAVDPNDGFPVFRAVAYRHFPRGTYVTSAAAVVLKQ